MEGLNGLNGGFSRGLNGGFNRGLNGGLNGGLNEMLKRGLNELRSNHAHLMLNWCSNEGQISIAQMMVK